MSGLPCFQHIPQTPQRLTFTFCRQRNSAFLVPNDTASIESGRTTVSTDGSVPDMSGSPQVRCLKIEDTILHRGSRQICKTF